MRIFHLAPHCRAVGNGVVNVAVDLACKQAEMGHSVAFGSAGGSYSDLLASFGVQHFQVEEVSRQPAAALRALLAVRRALKSYRPDVINAHAVPGALLAKAARGRSGPALITTVHNEPQRQAVLMGVGDRVIAVSDSVAKSMARRGIAQSKLRTVKNGTLGSPRLTKTATETVRLQRPAIVTVARLFHQKGIRELIQAFGVIAPDFPEANLYIVGEGPDRSEFEKLSAASAGAGRVHFVGFVPDPRPYLNDADIFVLASRKDPFPLVIPEAREAGCAIIASNVDGIPEALEGGRAGILVSPGDVSEIADAMRRLLGRPEELALFRARARENLDWLQLQRVADETLSIYRDALASRSR